MEMSLGQQRHLTMVGKCNMGASTTAWMPFHSRSCSSCWRKKGLSFLGFFFQGIKNEFHYDPSVYSQQWVQTTQHIYKINAQNKAEQDNCLTSGLLKI